MAASKKSKKASPKKKVAKKAEPAKKANKKGGKKPLTLNQRINLALKDPSAKKRGTTLHSLALTADDDPPAPGKTCIRFENKVTTTTDANGKIITVITPVCVEWA
jgi:hypothetical protein